MFFLGIFLRRVYLQYQKMSFTDTGILGKSVESYLQSSRINDMHDISSSDIMINQQSDIMINQQSEKRHVTWQYFALNSPY